MTAVLRALLTLLGWTTYGIPYTPPDVRASRRARRADLRRTRSRYAAKLLSAWLAAPRVGRTLHRRTLRAVARGRAWKPVARRDVDRARRAQEAR